MSNTGDPACGYANACETADFLAALRAELIEDEGLCHYAYVDSTGHVSIGIGRNLSDCGLSAAEVDLLWHDDIATAVAQLDVHVTWWRGLNPARQRVMLNLCFNLGWPRLAGFVRFLAAMQAGRWQDAAAELQNSRWWSQIGLRGPRMVHRLLAEDATP